MKIEVLDEASQDIIDGFFFYEKQAPGLGAYFVDSLIADIESLHLRGGTHSMRFGYHREILRDLLQNLVVFDRILDLSADSS